jgi:hypothetical protein
MQNKYGILKLIPESGCLLICPQTKLIRDDKQNTCNIILAFFTIAIPVCKRAKT